MGYDMLPNSEDWRHKIKIQISNLVPYYGGTTEIVQDRSSPNWDGLGVRKKIIHWMAAARGKKNWSYHLSARLSHMNFAIVGLSAVSTQWYWAKNYPWVTTLSCWDSPKVDTHLKLSKRITVWSQFVISNTHDHHQVIRFGLTVRNACWTSCVDHEPNGECERWSTIRLNETSFFPCPTSRTYASQKENRYFSPTLYILSHYFTELQNTEKRLVENREKLSRILTGQHDVRGREKKIEALQKTIDDLELKISSLQDVVSSPTPGQSAVSRPSTVRIIQAALGHPPTLFMPKVVKQEQLESIFLGNGPGSEQHPMQIDADIPEM